MKSDLDQNRGSIGVIQQTESDSLRGKAVEPEDHQGFQLIADSNSGSEIVPINRSL